MVRKLYALIVLLFLMMILPMHNVIAEEVNENRSVIDAIEEEKQQNTNNNETTTEREQEQEENIADPINDEQEIPISMNEQNTFLMFVQLIAALIFVIFLIYMLLRFVNKRTQSYNSTKLLQNIGGVALGANRSVQLVKVGDRLLVVGVGDSIQLLKELDDPIEIERLSKMQQQQFEQMDQPLSKALSKLAGSFRTKSKLDQEKTNTSNEQAFKALLNNQLNDVSSSQKKIHDEVREREK
ncbi:flagellar biosynthetic protein FliO [Bacillus sp. FJAT-45037]|uniref:flagellar biosynthetic protein FliO n=1 Tax=Bacillus sp. FJAT-45037 TaxID=2011007 RepID=UPI0012FDB3A5|nr:flagellar biosynthetic protein FliO [Bacillus sp. FJAT-45037]